AVRHAIRWGCGGNDLSVSSIVALTSFLGCFIVSPAHGLNPDPRIATAMGLVAMLVGGGAVGLLNGTAVVRFGMPPFIVTLTTMMFLSGLAIWMTGSRGIADLPASFTAIGGRTWIALVVALTATLVAHLTLSH